MNIVLIILSIIITILAIITCLYFHMYNKFTESIIRIDEAEIRIDNNIRDKYDTLCKIIGLAKNIIKMDDDKFADINKLKARRMSNFDTDRILTKWYNEFEVLYNDNIKLREDDEIYKTKKQIESIDEELEALRTYYNTNILNYNKMVKSFPTLIIALIKKYKERPGYDLKDMHDNDLDDFKL